MLTTAPTKQDAFVESLPAPTERISRSYRIPDTRKLYVEVFRNGTKKFKLRYFKNHRQRYISVGEFPLITVAQAELKAFEIERQIVNDEYVSRQAKEEFYKVAEKAIEAYGKAKNLKLKTIQHYKKRLNIINRTLARKPIHEVNVSDLRKIYSEYEERGTLEMLKRINQLFQIVFKYAIKKEFIKKTKNPLLELDYDENYEHYRAATATHHPILVTEEDISAFLENVANCPDTALISAVATLLMLNTGLRLESLCEIKWSYFNEDFSTLWYSKSDLKGEKATEDSRQDLILPIAPAMAKILKAFKNTVNNNVKKHADIVFLGRDFEGKPRAINKDALRDYVKRTSDYKITPHGARGTFTTWTKKLFDEHGLPLAYIRMYLHQQPEDDEFGVSYTHLNYTDEKVQKHLRKMAEWWEKFLLDKYDYTEKILSKLF